jgi:beta-glucuronidase
VNYLCRVYLNGQEIGSHEGGYTAFALDATGKLKAGRNHLAVMVDNRATSIKWPPCLGYFNYGGIHRSVSLEIMVGPWLDDARCEAVPDARGGRLTVRAAIRRHRPGLKIRVESGGLSREELVAEDGTVVCEAPLPGVEAWSPDNPVLYPLRVRLMAGPDEALDEWTGCCGFRAVGMKDGRVHLNGKPYPLKGICYVYDSPATGLVMTPEQMDADLRLMKAAGCNAVRCHYPMDAVFYDACDRIGLLVWIEPPVYCYHPGDTETGTRFADPVWLALAQEMAREMIAVARNHPSVAIYSLGNECNTRNPEAGAFFRRLAATIRETEFGADSVPGFRAPARDLWSEDYHADLLRAIFALAQEYPRIIGTFPFALSDYRDPSKVHNGWWNELNLKGIVDYQRQRKLAFAAVREAYA